MQNTLLEIEAGELGVIKNAKIGLKPFTIFFGKNNTGKTYLAYLIYGVCSITELLPDHIKLLLADAIKKVIKDISECENDKKYEIKFKVSHEYLVKNNYIKLIFNNDIKIEKIKLKLNLPEGGYTKFLYRNFGQ